MSKIFNIIYLIIFYKNKINVINEIFEIFNNFYIIILKE